MINEHAGLLAIARRFPRPDVMFGVFNLRQVHLCREVAWSPQLPLRVVDENLRNHFGGVSAS